MPISEPTGKAPTPNRLESLTGVRVLLALMVVLCHGWIRCEMLPADHWASKIFDEMGRCGVVGFFVLSGYILAHVYRDREWSTREFVVNRVARIYPLYLIGLIFTFPIDWITPGMPSEGRTSAFGLSIILLQSWLPFSRGRFNAPGWTLSVEALFYALFPLLFFLWRRSPPVFLGLTLAVCLFTASLWEPNSFFLSYGFPLMRVWEFMFGMGLAMIPLRAKFTAAEFVPLSLVVASPFVAALLHQASPPFTKWLAMVILASVSIVILAARDTATENTTLNTRTPLLRLKWMVIGGEISYGLYLLHDGVMRYSRVGFEKLFNVLLKDAVFPMKFGYLLTTAVVSLALAWICWILVEIPARRFLRNKLAPHG